MSAITTIVLLTTLAGLCIPLGALLASIKHIKPLWLEQELRHFVIALGGGILLGAVAVVLVPEGIKQMEHSLLAIVLFMLGGLCFFIIERFLGLNRHSSPQLMGMLLDYIPEAMALGGLIALGSPAAPLLAVLIGIQNLPEGFNAYRELKQLNHKPPKLNLLIMLLLVPLGPIAALISFSLFADQPYVLGGIMLFASGGILYLIFQDIAPQSRLENHWAPPLGAVLGFSIALFSEMLFKQTF